MLVLLQKEKGISDYHDTDHTHLLKPLLPLILMMTLVRLEPTWEWLMRHVTKINKNNNSKIRPSFLSPSQAL